MSAAILACEGVTVTRGGRALLDAVSLDLRPGEVLAVLGENGAGKSTLVRVLAGDLLPQRGTASAEGHALRELAPRALALRRAVLPQDSQVAFPFTALEVTLLGRSPHCGGHFGATDTEIARAALGRTDALHLEHRLFPTLSGGERARVMLARVLAQLWEPAAHGRALLLDEPAAALDVAQQHRALTLAREFARGARSTVLAVMHDLNLAARFADRVALLKDGRLIGCGTPREALTEASASRCYSFPMVRIASAAAGQALFVAAPD